MKNTNLSNVNQVEMSFLEKLTKALNGKGDKVSAQYLCSAPKKVPTAQKKSQ